MADKSAKKHSNKKSTKGVEELEEELDEEDVEETPSDRRIAFFLIGFSLLLALALMFFSIFSGPKNIEGELPDLMDKVYVGIPEDNRPMMLMNTEVTDENAEYYIGTKDIEYEAALASESGVGSIAHSVVLIRLKDASQAEEAKQKIRDNIDTRKWICVGIEKEDLIVESRGNLILVVIDDEEEDRKNLLEAFNAL